MAAGRDKGAGALRVRFFDESYDFMTVRALQVRDFKITEVGLGPVGGNSQNDDGRRVADVRGGCQGLAESLRVGDRMVRRQRRGDRVAVALEVERRPEDGRRGIAARRLAQDPRGRHRRELGADEVAVLLRRRHENGVREGRDPLKRVGEQALRRDERKELFGAGGRRKRPEPRAAAAGEEQDPHRRPLSPTSIRGTPLRATG